MVWKMGMTAAMMILLGGAELASAAAVASDNASDTDYDNGWQTGDDGGSGWGGSWTLGQTAAGNGSQNGHFVGDSNGNGDGSGPGINTPTNRAWAAYANSGQTADATRPFSGGLSVGQTVGVSVDNGFLDGGAVVGFGLRDSSNTNRFEFYYKGGDSVNSYKYVDSTGEQNLSPNLGFDDGGLTLALTLTGANTYSFTATRLFDSATRTISSGMLSAGGEIDRIRLFNFNSGGGGAANAYFNSISVPEPMSLGLVMLAGLQLTARRRRAV